MQQFLLNDLLKIYNNENLIVDAMRQTVQKAIRAGVKGIKVQISGRLNGADIARAENYVKVLFLYKLYVLILIMLQILQKQFLVFLGLKFGSFMVKN